jgi:acyl carrier protein
MQIDELLEKDPGTLQGPEALEDVGWDSLGIISFIALVDENLEYTVRPKELAQCKTVEDLLALVADRLSPVPAA